MVGRELRRDLDLGETSARPQARRNRKHDVVGEMGGPVIEKSSKSFGSSWVFHHSSRDSGVSVSTPVTTAATSSLNAVMLSL